MGERPPLCLRGQYTQSGLLVGWLNSSGNFLNPTLFQHEIGEERGGGNLTFAPTLLLRKESGFGLLSQLTFFFFYPLHNYLYHFSCEQPSKELRMSSGRYCRKNCTIIIFSKSYRVFQLPLYDCWLFNPPWSVAVRIRYEQVLFPK